MPTVAGLIAEWRAELGTVPSVDNDFVCQYCLGPVTGYPQCASCLELFVLSGMPTQLQESVVPMTSALNPSPWYTALATYKGFQPQHGAILASVAYRFLETHQASIGNLIGRPATILTIVPSKRGITYDQQPLRAALSRVQSLKDQLRQTLAYDSTKSIGRKEYNPAAFTVGPDSSEGMRVVLIEDTWVTGATAMSAAGALLRYGAESVAVFPIARVLNDHYWASDHPYRRAMAEPYDDANPRRWPR